MTTVIDTSPSFHLHIMWAKTDGHKPRYLQKQKRPIWLSLDFRQTRHRFSSKPRDKHSVPVTNPGQPPPGINILDHYLRVSHTKMKLFTFGASKTRAEKHRFFFNSPQSVVTNIFLLSSGAFFVRFHRPKPIARPANNCLHKIMLSYVKPLHMRNCHQALVIKIADGFPKLSGSKIVWKQLVDWIKQLSNLRLW